LRLFALHYQSPSNLNLPFLSFIFQDHCENCARSEYISEIEHLWSELRGNTGVLYSDILENILNEINESELISKKKRVLKKRHRFTDKQKMPAVYINNQWKACFFTL
jgi:hypothetical protein